MLLLPTKWQSDLGFLFLTHQTFGADQVFTKALKKEKKAVKHYSKTLHLAKYLVDILRYVSLY